MDLVEQEIRNTKTSETEFIRKKKTILSSCIFMSDSIHRMNDRMVNDFVKYKRVRSDIYDQYQNLNYADFRKVVDALDFQHKSILIINPRTSN